MLGFKPMRICSWIVILIMFVMLMPGAAQAACYTPTEAEAEQGLRIRSELMVIGLNCQHMARRTGQDLFATYRVFSSRHAALFSQYEKTLLDHYRKSGDPDPETHLNTLRTGLANKISVSAATIRPDIFCTQHAERIAKANAMDEKSFRRWAATPYADHPPSEKMCGG